MFPAIHTAATPATFSVDRLSTRRLAWAAIPGAMRWLVPPRQYGAVIRQLEPALQHILQGKCLKQDQMALLFRDPYTVDTTSPAVQAAFDGTSLIADRQEALRPEVIGEDQIPERPRDLVSVFAGHFLPRTIVVG